MSAEPIDWAAFWDQRYRRDDYAFGQAPNQHLRAQCWRLPAESRVLLPADGEGRNGVYLAGLGHRVTSVDISPLGSAKAQALAAERGVTMDVITADLETWTWPVAAYDAVASIFFHLPPAPRRLVHRAMAAALKPGGVLILEAYHPDQLPLKAQFGSGGPGDVTLLYDEPALVADFEGLAVTELMTGLVTLAEGPLHTGPAAVIRAVLQKPA
jgi:SAM-dependent methyltransferase